MTPQEYIANGGTKCPVCGSEDIEGDSFDVDAGSAAQRIDCNDCNSYWIDDYRLVGFVMVESTR